MGGIRSVALLDFECWFFSIGVVSWRKSGNSWTTHRETRCRSFCPFPLLLLGVTYVHFVWVVCIARSLVVDVSVCSRNLLPPRSST